MAETNFADRLIGAIEAKGTPLVVGLDPVYDQLPPAIREQRELNDPNNAQAVADALAQFCNRVIKVVSPHVPAVKINIAYFERYLAAGMEAFGAVVQEAHANGLLVIADAKRSDIGHTCEQYATAMLEDPAFDDLEDQVAADAVTVNPYFGIDGVKPFVDVAKDYGKGAFVLVRTSNKSAGEIQDMADAAGVPLYQKVGKLVEQWGKDLVGARGYSSVGAVVGATHPEQLAELRKLLPGVLFLVPGFGAQGGTAKDIAGAFKADGTGAIINASRSIIYAFAQPKFAGEADWERAVEAAVVESKQAIATGLLQ